MVNEGEEVPDFTLQADDERKVSMKDHRGKKVEIPRIYLGKQQAFETLINEEALQFARYLRGTLESWNPRMPTLD